MTLYWKALLGVILAVLPLTQAAPLEGEHSLSLVTMVPLLELEKKLIDNLDDYAKALDQKLQVIRSHILDMRAENEKGRLNPMTYLSNPLNGLSLIRRLHQDWVGWLEYMEQSVGIVQMRNMDAWHRELPTQVDLSEACDGIVRIQNVYNLRVGDIIRGKLAGRQYDARMSNADIFAVGYYLRKTSSFAAAFQWLKEVRHLSPEDLSSHQDHLFSPEKAVIKVLTTMHVNEGHFSVALRLLNYWLKLFPHDAYPERVRLALKEHMKYQPEAPYSRPFDLVTDAATKELRWSCNGFRRSRHSGRLHCSYNSSTTPFLRLAPLKMEQIGLEPYVVLYHDVLYPREISELQSLVIGRLRTTYSGDQQSTAVRRVRSGKALWVNKEFRKLTRRIKRRIQDISGLDLADSEKLQIINYGIGGHYDVHTDFFNISGNSDAFPTTIKLSGDRMATVLFYLSDVEQGGATVFPFAGYSVLPRSGTALFWYNLHTDGSGDMATIHAACPVIVGSKWIMTQWIAERKQIFKRPCLSPSPGNY